SKCPFVLCRKHKNPLFSSILRSSWPVCKPVRAFAEGCEKQRKFRSSRGFCGSCAEELRKGETAGPCGRSPVTVQGPRRSPQARQARGWSFAGGGATTPHLGRRTGSCRRTRPRPRRHLPDAASSSHGRQ